MATAAPGEREAVALLRRVRAILGRHGPEDAIARLRRLLGPSTSPSRCGSDAGGRGPGAACRIVGRHPAMQTALAHLARIAPTDLPVLLLGESGTGKGVFADLLHRQSLRHSGPFIKVNCAALPDSLIESELFGHERGAFTGAIGQRKGRFELADGGTLFLDEIGEISPTFQAKLLRVLQDGEFERVGGSVTRRANVRLVAATNRDLAQSVWAGTFRADLYYRLAVLPLHLPALRERRSDIPLLAERILADICAALRTRKRFDSTALNVLTACDFPGNIRELENCVRRGAVMADTIVTSAHLACSDGDCATCPRARATAGSRGQSHHTPVDSLEQMPEHAEAAPAGVTSTGTTKSPRHLIAADSDANTLVAALQTSGWSQAKAARLLGVTPRQIAYAIRKHGIKIVAL